MSMSATFIQVDETELSAFRADPSLVERLFADSPSIAPDPTVLTETVRDRVRTTGPQLLAGALNGLDPTLRQQIESRLGLSTSAMAAGEGGDAILKLMEQRRGTSATGAFVGPRPVLSLDTVWHGVHYVLCGDIEPGTTPLSQVVLGGVVLGEDDEGFAGYGPPRYFTSALVADYAKALEHPDIEAAAAGRFNPARMSSLGVYPGWQPSDANRVINGVRRLREFYADAAAHGRAIVTCLV